MPTFKESAFWVQDGVTYYFKDKTARDLLEKCYSPSNPPPATEGGRIWYATCSTASGTGAKTATTSTGDFVLATGSMVRILFTTSNTAANPTISIDGSAAKAIRPISSASGMANKIAAGEVIDLVYDGSNFVMTKGNAATTSFYGITKLSSATNSTAEDVAATPKAVKDAADAKVDKAGDTMTGNLYVTKAGTALVQAENSNTGVKLNLDTGSGANHGIWTYGYYDGSSFHSDEKYMIYRNGSGNVIVNGKATDNVLKSGDTITGPIVLNSSAVYIKQKLADTSNYATPLVFENATPSSYTYKPHIGFHNTGGNSSNPGVINLVPFGTNTGPWGRADGLSISRDNVKFNGSDVRTGTVAVANGGTGATTAEDAKTNLGLKTVTTLSLTYTTNTLVTSTSFARLQAFRKNGILFLNGNMLVQSGSQTSDFTEIGNIAGWSAVSSYYASVPPQGAAGPSVTVSISTSGKITLYIGVATTATLWYRFAACIPASSDY